MRRVTRSTAALAGVLAFSLLAASCSSDDSKSTDAKPKDSDTPSASVNDINATPRSEVADGGKLTWPLSAMPANFNPSHLDGTERDTADIVSAMLPAPFDFDAKAQPVLKKEYVESADLTTTPKQVVTYKLNQDAVWADGSKITAADYEAFWKANNGTNEAYQISSSQGYDKIASVAKGADDHEVVVTFAEPYTDWRGLFGGLVPASTTNDPKIFNEGWVEKPLTTAGPFALEGIDKTAQTVTLVRNEKWWGAKAKLERIIYRVITTDAQIDALANGEIDFIDIGPDADKYARAKTTAGVELRRAGGPNFRHLDMNGTSEVLKDVNVRRALALGIDRDIIAKALLGPLGGTPTPLHNHIFMSNQNGYKNNAGELTKPDKVKAAALLDAAGWKLSGTTRQKDGKPLEIRFVIPAEVATSAKEADLVLGMLAEIGVKVKIEVVPSDDFFEKYVTPGNFDFTVFSWIGTPFPISSSKSIYAKPKPGADGELDIQQNYARTGTDEIDALFDKATSEFDEDKAADLANAIDALIWKEVHSLTTYQRPDIFAAKKGLANLGAEGFATIVYEDIGFVKA